jgi:hypothetical protein
VLFGDHGLGFGQGWVQPLLLIDRISRRSPSPRGQRAGDRLRRLLRNILAPIAVVLSAQDRADRSAFDSTGRLPLVALGRPVSLDFGSIYVPSIEQPWLHSTLDRPAAGVVAGEILAMFRCLLRTSAPVKYNQSLQRVQDVPEQPLPPV